MTSPNYSSKTQCALFPSQDPHVTDLAYVHDFLKQFWIIAQFLPTGPVWSTTPGQSSPWLSEKSPYFLLLPVIKVLSFRGRAAVCYCLNFSPSNYLWEWIFYNTFFIKVHPVITYHNTQITSEGKVMKLIKVPSQIDER